MEKEEQSIVEQEVEVVAEAVGTRLRLILDWLQANILTLESILPDCCDSPCAVFVLASAPAVQTCT